MIELFGGVRDFGGDLRRFFGARGTIQPLGSDVIQPVVDVGPSQLHIYRQIPNVITSWRETLAAAATATRYICNPPGSTQVAVLKYFRLGNNAVLGTQLSFLATISAVSGAAGNVQVVNNDAGSTLPAINSFLTPTVLLNRAEIAWTIGGVIVDTGDVSIFPGQALAIVSENLDAVNRQFSFTAIFDMEPLP